MTTITVSSTIDPLEKLVAVHGLLARGLAIDPQEAAELELWREHGPWIQTHSGRCYPLLAPRPEDVDIGDIAYALSNLARYTGHAARSCQDGSYFGPSFGVSYSVAQHSVLVSRLVPEEHALAALMHDAAEAYVGDASAPLKRCIPDLARVERISWLAIARRFGLPLVLPAAVKHADLTMLATEQRDLMVPAPKPWPPMPEPHPDRIEIRAPYQAERDFLRRFHELHHQPKLRTDAGAGE